MEITDIVSAFKIHTGRFPRKAVEEAVRRQDEITPELLRVLEKAIEWERTHEDSEDENPAGQGCLFGLHLLAQFRETQAYPLVIALARLPKRSLDRLIGDMLVETLDRVLASVCGGDTTSIEALIEDPEVYEYARATGVAALKLLVAVGDKSRDEIMDYYKSLFQSRLERSYSFVWEELIACATRLHPEDVYEEIFTAYENGLGDTCYMSIQDVNKVRRMSPEKVLGRLRNATLGYVNDTAKELRPRACFNMDKAQQYPVLPVEDFYRPPTQPVLKSGPNDPCTCGSGRKFKKCCGRVV